MARPLLHEFLFLWREIWGSLNDLLSVRYHSADTAAPVLYCSVFSTYNITVVPKRSIMPNLYSNEY
jgi:hypothetical protein